SWGSCMPPDVQRSIWLSRWPRRNHDHRGPERGLLAVVQHLRSGCRGAAPAVLHGSRQVGEERLMGCGDPDIEKLQRQIRNRPECPWCDTPVHEDRGSMLIDGKVWHTGCRNDYDRTRYDSATLKEN